MRTSWEADKAAYEALKLTPLAQSGDYRCKGRLLWCGAAAVWPKVKDMQWVGLVSDDLVPCRSRWMFR